MSILTVGQGGFVTIASAVNAAKDGDTVQVKAGTYTNDFLNFSKNITLKAIGGQVKMVETTSPPNGKAMITESGNVTISGFDIGGVSVRDGNGAAIRYEGGNLTLQNDYFHNNQDGILTAADPNGTITIKHSEFAFNGSGSGNTHNLYVGGLKQLTIDDSYFHDANVGHEIKSRASNTTITNTRIIDNNSTSSYSIDLPNGGNANITNNVIEQGPFGQNPFIIAYGEEGQSNSGTTVKVANNTIVNDRHRGNEGLTLNPTGTTIAVTNNTVFGLTASQLGNGASGNNITTTRPGVNTAALSFINTPPVVTPPVVTPPPVVIPPVVVPPPVVTPPAPFSFNTFHDTVVSHATAFSALSPDFARMFAAWNAAFPPH